MYTFLGIDSLISGWITAHLLAVITVFFFKRTIIFDTIVDWLEKRAPNQFFHQNSRSLVFAFLVVFLGLILSIIIIVEPIQGGLIAFISNYFQTDSGWKQYFYIMEELFLIGGIMISLALMPLVNYLYSRICKVINVWRKTHFRVIRIHKLEILTPNQLVNVLLAAVKYIRVTVILLITLVCTSLVFSLFPQTEGWAQTILGIMGEVLVAFWESFLALLPNLISLIVVVVITRLALKLLRFFHDGLQQGKIKFSGIHPELIEPTFQLARFLVIALALVAAFPYIPGSSSPVFRGLSIFVGFLISLGSTSLITNIVSGIVLTYSRGLKIGDRVEIGDTLGDVIDRTILVTRIRTIKNVVITIPNAKVMQHEIINYSAEAREEGLILHTSVTIGYDAPWRKVQKLLINAAMETGNIMENPTPYVLKTNLDDHYVTYELNAYTSKPSEMAEIYSELHQNILDKFNEASVEIMSPTYFAFRDGQNSTIPEVNGNNNGKSKLSWKNGKKTSYSQYREKTQPLGTG